MHDGTSACQCIGATAGWAPCVWQIQFQNVDNGLHGFCIGKGGCQQFFPVFTSDSGESRFVTFSGAIHAGALSCFSLPRMPTGIRPLPEWSRRTISGRDAFHCSFTHEGNGSSDIREEKPSVHSMSCGRQGRTGMVDMGAVSDGFHTLFPFGSGFAPFSLHAARVPVSYWRGWANRDGWSASRLPFGRFRWLY